MPIYNINGTQAMNAYGIDGSDLIKAYGIDGVEIPIHEHLHPDYNDYSFIQKWASKGISSTQGFDIYNGKVFWVSKSGNSSVPANCYVWNLSDGSQALENQPITIYSGHGNNLCFDFPLLYATSAYTPHVYVNFVTDDFVFSLLRTLYINDGCKDCDACIDENDNTILWTLGHTAPSSDTSAPYYLSKWDLAQLAENDDGTFTPKLIKTIEVAQPANSFFYQGCKFHDGILWFANGYAGSSTTAYIFGVDPDTGEYLYSINCGTTAEPEGIAWVKDADAIGGYAMYVGFQNMAFRKYIFGAI